ncbi:hypothetical protein OJ253_3609 [Cryptosporidium canis]|uniref:Uncharacterized protein n=1 Tax=Cryptosporidium canis TaxID=195482 RepID=A0A9D5HVQ5_9CRYT|nr:hypothetical protein OJ253_3609 [Cryptosporidium canis]
MRVKECLRAIFTAELVIWGLSGLVRLAGAEDLGPGRGGSWRRRDLAEGEDVRLEAELEAFRVTSDLSTSFVRRIPKQFEQAYVRSDGTARGMYRNCMHGFLMLIRGRELSPVLYVRTLVYRLGKSYYFDLGEIRDKESRGKAKATKLHVGQAIHLFCIRASGLVYTRDAARSLEREIRAGLQQRQGAEAESGSQSRGNASPEVEEAVGYLEELLRSEILSVEIEGMLGRGGGRGVPDIDAERRRDRRRIREYEQMVWRIGIPLPESRLRDRYGQVHHQEAENKLGVSQKAQRESDRIKSRLEEIRREEKILSGTGERFVDVERRKFLEAALKRNQLLSFERSRRECSERLDVSREQQDARLRCECGSDDDCECRLVDVYGEIMGRPVSIKLEEDLLNDYQIFKSKEKLRKAEVKYFKGLLHGGQEPDNTVPEDDSSGARRRLSLPSSFVEIPLSGLSRLQLMTLEQLSGIDINSRILAKDLPRIREISHEKNTKVSESVPVNEESRDSEIRKPKSILSSRNKNYN